jgi:hypothetical protein
VKHKGALAIWNEILREKNVNLKMQTHKLNLDEEVKNMDVDRKLCWSQQV